MDDRERDYTDAWESEHFPGGTGDIERMQAEQSCPSCAGSGQETDAVGVSQGECLRCCGSGRDRDRRERDVTETPTGPTQGIYRERAHLVALLAALYPSHIGYTDPNEPDWAVVIVEAPGGQLSWHIAPGDMDLFGHVRPTNRICRGWDGHSTDEKYRRIRELAATTEPFPLPALAPPVWLTRDVSAVTAKPLTDELFFAEILAHVPNCRYGCVACEAAPALVAEVRELRSRIGGARAEIARRDVNLGHGPVAAGDVREILADIETHLVDPEYRPAPVAQSGPTGGAA